MLKQQHNELSLFVKKIKLLYISELLSKDEEFDEEVRQAMKRALKKCPKMPKLVSTEDLQQWELLDMMDKKN